MIFIAMSNAAFTQITNERTKQIFPQNDTLIVDSLSIIPGSFSISANGIALDSMKVKVDELSSTIFILDSTHTDTLTLSYRVFPIRIEKEYRNKNTDMIATEGGGVFKPYTINSGKNISELLGDDGIQKSGSISRGIAFGNTQNLSVNSTLNLQLSGRLTERYQLLASVTDDNIPIQPDGSTQQLQDFDQVFIQVYDDNSKLIAGDFVLKRPTGYFMNYFKRAQGGYVSTTAIVSRKGNSDVSSPSPLERAGVRLTIEASGAVSKGRFARNTIQGVEGNQGPYRLTGADGELFIIVLAGTEAVYIDGKKLERGQDRDYVIDYNAAEIIFTPRQFITKDRRIVVEFQYSEKRYARPMLQTSIMLDAPKADFYLNLFSESDAKNQPLQQDLAQGDKAILAAAGDELLSAFTTGVDSVAFDDNLVLYALRDSLTFDSVFVHSTNPDSAYYRLVFTPVGSGNGDYVEDGFTANGRKFKWVLPIVLGDDTLHQGNYSPIILLSSPKKKQMVALGGKILLGDNSSVAMEGAMSVNDLNTFSSLDANDDVGYSTRIVHEWKKTLIDRDTSDTISRISPGTRNLKLGTLLSYEFTDHNFKPIERFREVEFERNWNVQNLNLNNDQHIVGTGVKIESTGFGSIALGGDAFLIGQSYSGYRVKLQPNIRTKTFTALVDASYLDTRGQLKTSFIRHKSNISQAIGKFKIGFRDEHEWNQFYLNNSDTLTAASYRFYDWEVNAGTTDTLKKSFTVFYRERTDSKLDSTLLNRAAFADQYGFIASFRGKKENLLRLSVSNRRLRAINPELFTGQPENTLLTRLEYNFRVRDGFITSSTFYEVGSGLEQQREFIYIEVQPGQGNYVWIDYDADAVKDLDEFEIAQFTYEANYIRTFVQSNEYQRTYTNQFSQSLNFTPSRILKDPKGLKKFIARFTDQVSLKVDRKTTSENEETRFNPFIDAIADSTLLALNSSVRNVLFFNKSNPAFGMDFTMQDNRNKNLLSNGFESRTDRFQQLGIRGSLVHDVVLSCDNRVGEKSAASDFLSGRNYVIAYFSIEPKLTWQPGTSQRFSLLAEVAEKDNTAGQEFASILKFGGEATLSSVERGSLQASLNYYRIRYNSGDNNSLAFEMLEGLGTGNNFTWSASLQRSIAKNLQLTLLYNGRKPEEVKTIHSGGVQVRAVF
ncbi:MAG: hypothetical protein SH856_09545 [Flavobacteriales bacterium]|nr:hypothetical protein [Flavobacteriales bacterium]